MTSSFRALLLSVMLIASPSVLAASMCAIAPPQITDPSQGEDKGFAAKVLATTDANWEEKWNTPPETAPHFTSAEEIGMEEKVSILVFFINPGQDASGQSILQCDVKVFGPENEVALDKKGIECFRGNLPGDERYVYLSPMVLQVVPEPQDKPGLNRIEITVHDQVREAKVELKTQWTRVLPPAK